MSTNLGEDLQGRFLRGGAGALVGPPGEGGLRPRRLEDGLGGQDRGGQQPGK